MEAKQIVTESKGYLKIEDILPLMGDSVKIGEFKDELKECINNYEKSVQKLNKGMKEFNITTNLIQKDITNTKKSVDFPVAIVLGGQPGAGKSNIYQIARKRFSNN